MIEIIESLLGEEGFAKIKTSIPYISLFVKYGTNSSKAIQLFDCENTMEVSKEQLAIFNTRAEEFLKTKGYEDIALINILVVGDMIKARGIISTTSNCWIIDSKEYRLRVFESQPNDFEGLRSIISGKLFEFVPPNVFDDEKPDIKITDPKVYQHYIEDEEQTFYQNLCATDVLDLISKDIEEPTNEHVPKNSMYIGNSRMTLVNTIIVAMNVIVFLWLGFKGPVGDGRYLVKNGAMYAPLIMNGEYYRLVTCMFLHASLEHLIGNMLILVSLGDNLERAIGWPKFLVVYLGGGLLGSVCSCVYAWAYNPQVPSVGASGAIFAMIGGLLWMVVINGGKLEDITTIKVVLLIVYSLYSGLRAQNVDNAAHIGGLVGGFVLAYALYNQTNNKTNKG